MASRFHVEQRIDRHDPDSAWVSVIGSEGNRSYALGWMHGMLSFYPCPALRVIRNDDGKVIEQNEGHGAPKPACPQR